MRDADKPGTDPLLTSVTSEHLALLGIIGDAIAKTGGWPVYQYVEAQMDDLGLDADAVMRSMPSIHHGQLNYSLIWRNNQGNSPETLIKLTIAGFAHLPAYASTVTMFFNVLAELIKRRSSAGFDPGQVIDVTVSGAELIHDLGLTGEPLVALLPDILGREPSTWHGGGNINGDLWAPQPSTFMRRFRDVHEIAEYLYRLRAWIEPLVPPAEPVLASPLSLVAAFDYLDVVWRLRFGAGLLVIPSAERTARLAFDATTADEFDNRLSALGETFKGFDVPGDPQQGSLRRLRSVLKDTVTAQARVRIDAALATLQAVTHVRNAGQHMDAATDAAAALPTLGLTYPVDDFELAWRIVEAHVVQALDTIREEIRATVPAAAARDSGGTTRRRRR